MHAPFNGKVISENVDVGQVIGPQTAICRLVGTDRFWIQVSIPVPQLKWIELPGTESGDGSDVNIIIDNTGDGPITRDGRIVRLLPDLDDVGRMARLLVAVDDPLNLGNDTRKYPLLLGTFVEVEIAGKVVEDIMVIPNAALRRNNTVWIMAPDDTLKIVPVEVIWRRKDTTIVRSDFPDDTRLITSKITTPVEGMELRVLEGADDVRPGTDGEMP